MNWRFWRWLTDAERLREQLRCADLHKESYRDAMKQVEATLDRVRQERNALRRENEALKDMLGFIDMVPRNEAAAIGLMEQLTVVTANTPWWKNLNGLLESEAQQAVNDTLMPDLSNDAVNVRRGRAGMVKDLQGILRRLWLQAQQQTPNPKPRQP